MLLCSVFYMLSNYSYTLNNIQFLGAEAFFLGLTDEGDKTNPKWLNGMPFSVTEANTGIGTELNAGDNIAYHFYGSVFDDMLPFGEQQVLCQANLDNLDWNAIV